jgi:hypothetical protein
LLTGSDNFHTSLTSIEMTTEKIHTVLKTKNKTLTIIDCSKNHTVNCWKRFGFPAVANQNGEVVKKFENFIS